ncbi:MAG: hypothetical protein ACLPIX_15800 [Rhodomicrobium sp.]
MTRTVWMLLRLGVLLSIMPGLPAPQAQAGPYPLVFAYLGYSNAVNAVALSPDGRHAVSGSGDNVLRLWDMATGLLLRTFDAQTDSINAVAFSPDGRQILTGGNDRRLRLWDVATGQEVKTLEGHAGEVMAVAFAPDGHRALSASKDKTVKLWDLDTGLLLKSFEGHTDEVLTVAFSADGRRALSGSKDKTLKLWDIETALQVKAVEGPGNNTAWAALPVEGRQAESVEPLKAPGGQGNDATPAAPPVDIAKAEPAPPLKTFEGHGSDVTSAALSSDGRQALSGSRDRTLKLWDVETGRLLKTFEGHSDEVLSVAFRPDGARALSGSKDKTVKLWDVRTGQLLKTLEGHSDAVASLAVSADGSQILSGSADKTLKLWNTGTAQLLSTIDIPSVTFSPGGHQAFSLFGSFPGATLPGTPDLARLNERLKEKDLKRGDPVFLRIFKADLQAELWMKKGERFELFATYPICAWSGQLGPKVQEGDYQSPEGFYSIGKGQLNPNSRYHLAFNLGYPNLLDRAYNRTGAFIMVHGSCASVGCYAMTDPVIDELWALVTAALDGGQDRVEVHVFPFRMTQERLTAFAWHPWAEFWQDLKPAYDLFEASHIPPQIGVCNKRYAVRRMHAASGSAPALQSFCPARR